MLTNTYMENVWQNISMHYEYRVGAKKQFGTVKMVMPV